MSHPVTIGVSNHYALKPQSRSLARIPEQPTEIDKNSNTNTGTEITDEEEEDDYEKMQSYAVKEEAIQAWRMSHLSNASSYGSFTPPSLQSRRSEHFGSYPSSTPQMPSIRPRSELHLPYSPGSPHNLQVPTGRGGGGTNQKRNSVVPSTQTTDSNSPWARGHVSNINTDNSSIHGNTTTPTSHSNHAASKSPQRPTTQGIGGSVASNSPRAPLQQTTKATVVQGVSTDGRDSTVKPVTHPTPPQLPAKIKTVVSPVNRSPVPSRKHDSPTLPKKTSRLSGSSADVAAEPERPFAGIRPSLKKATGSTQQAEEPGKVNLVKARLEKLEKKASTLKPGLTQKPRPGIVIIHSATVSSDIARVYAVWTELMG